MNVNSQDSNQRLIPFVSFFLCVVLLKDFRTLTLFWTGGGANFWSNLPPAGFFNIAQKPLGLGS